jgi:NAD(P)-dependent dehydrogenase (short-subunit alcohol dehydrogenase family)
MDRERGGGAGPGMDLTGRVVVVTGAGRGLGLAYAGALARSGAAVVVNDADEAAAAGAAEGIVAAGGTAIAEVGPVGGAEVADRLVARAVDAFGRLDALVTNAGILRDRVLWKMSDEDFDAVVDVHLRGTFTCVRAAVRQMRAQGAQPPDGGRIIVVGSPAGQRGNFGQTNYSAAKAAVVGMVRTWAMECGRAGITVNAVVPVAATAMTATMPAFAPHVEALERDGTAFPAWLRAGEGFGTPEDAAGLVVYLASAASAGVTGQAIGIGGDKLSVWAHPTEVAAAYRAGGWSAEAIAQAWRTAVGRSAQSVGIPAPRDPDEPREEPQR